MHREYKKWYSPSLGRDMEMLIFGHGGTPILVFPTSMGRFHEWEDFKMVDALSHQLASGHNQLFCVDSVDGESFYNKNADPFTRIMRYNQYQDYIFNEVMPLIYSRSHNHYVMVAGASFGAYHAVNMALKQPVFFGKVIAMGGAYDIKTFMDGFYDSNVYFNNPLDFMSNLSDYYTLELIRRMDIRLVTGEHDMCWDSTSRLSEVLYSVDIPHDFDLWGFGTGHDWPWWRQMIIKHVVH